MAVNIGEGVIVEVGRGVEVDTCGLDVIVDIGVSVNPTVEVNTGSGVIVAVEVFGRTDIGNPAQETTKNRMKIILK